MNVDAIKPGEWMNRASLTSQVDFSRWKTRIPTDRHKCKDRVAREFETLWMKVWQIAGRAEELPKAGDWKVHKIQDQSFLLVQMTDYQYWLFFPNVFIRVCAGRSARAGLRGRSDGHRQRGASQRRSQPVSLARHVSTVEAEQAAKAEPVRIMPAGEHCAYHWVLQQDFDQMPIQQDGLRHRLYTEMLLTRSEPRVAHFHAAMDQWVERATASHR